METFARVMVSCRWHLTSKVFGPGRFTMHEEADDDP